jgi:hypothetical protein
MFQDISLITHDSKYHLNVIDICHYARNPQGGVRCSERERSRRLSSGPTASLDEDTEAKIERRGRKNSSYRLSFLRFLLISR